MSARARWYPIASPACPAPITTTSYSLVGPGIEFGDDAVTTVSATRDAGEGNTRVAGPSGPLAVVGLPRPKAGPPAWHRPPVLLVLRAESTAQGRLLVPVDECCDRREEHGRVDEQYEPAQDEGLPDDDAADGQVHRVADVAVEAAHDQAVGRRDRGGRAEPLDREASERLEQPEGADGDQDP